jgi:4-amino-4-deoxy-L-arabinose transferase-like glycosyltransferase
MFALGVHEMWQRRATWFGRVGLVAMLLVTGEWSWWLLHRDSVWLPALRWTILTLTVAGTVALVAALIFRAHGHYVRAAVVSGVIVALTGSAAYAIATIGQPHTGGGPAVGPAATAQERGRAFGQNTDNPQLDAMRLTTHTDWSAAIARSSAAAGLELKTRTAVMAIGGFSGTDPVPTLSQFQQYVASHRVTYYIVADDNHDHGGVQGRRQHSDVTDWVAANYTPAKVGADTVFNLTVPAKH